MYFTQTSELYPPLTNLNHFNVHPYKVYKPLIGTAVLGVQRIISIQHMPTVGTPTTTTNTHHALPKSKNISVPV